MQKDEVTPSPCCSPSPEGVSLPRLNLPDCACRLRHAAGGRFEVYDTLRGRFVALTPEEWVRQHFTHFLTTVLGYPAALMGNEVSLKLNGMSRRCDTVVYDRRLRPRMIVEYKRPDVPVTQRVFNQICRYNMVMHVGYLVVSNGLDHYCCRMDYTAHTYHFVPHLPTWAECIGEEL